MALLGLFRPTHTYGANCRECGLDKTCRFPRIPLSGGFAKGILLLGGSPGAAEENARAPFRGDHYEKMKLSFRKFGINVERDCLMLHSLCCKLPNPDKGPSPKQLLTCRKHLETVLSEYRPQHIVCVGSMALEQLLRSTFAGSGIDLGESNWRGFMAPDHALGAWVYSILDPKILEKAYNRGGYVKDQGILNLYDRDIARICANSAYGLPEPLPMGKVRGTLDIKKIQSFVAEVESRNLDTAFDYETTGLKPFVEGHTVATIGIAHNEEAIAFPFEYPGIWTSDELSWIDNMWQAYLRNKKLPKVMHHVKFEQIWSKVIFGANPASILACTMQDAHIIDERKQFSKLKLQAYLQFGVRPYHTKVDKFLQASDEDASMYGGNAFNNVMKAPLDQLLYYNAQDAWYTKHLFNLQEQYLTAPENYDLLKQSGLFLRSAFTLSRMQIRGIPVDQEYYERMNRELAQMLLDLGDQLRASKENAEFRKVYKRDLDWGSADDLRALLYKVYKLKSPKKTEKGEDAVDKEVINGLKSDFGKVLLEWRKIAKVFGTYLAQFLRESHDGKMHPNFDLGTTRTGRGSSSAPNFQNVPVRDEYSKGITRKGIIPHKGFLIGETDFGSLEVRIIACYTRDVNLVAYVNDPSTDMHRDEAIDLFLLHGLYDGKDKFCKMLRFYAKNGWVFPEFYTSYYVNCARNMWESCENLPIYKDGPTLTQHLKSKGINGLPDFTQHCKEHETVFWEKFAGVREWQEEVWADFLQCGYTKSFFGFRRNGLLKKADVVNAPIQGTGFHCLLECMNELDARLIRAKTRSEVMAQIHDCILGNVHPSEIAFYSAEISDIMVNWLRARHEWMIVPMEVELEYCQVDEPWYFKKAYTMEEVKLWHSRLILK